MGSGLGRVQISMPEMTGQLGHRTMETNGASSASCIAHTPCVLLSCTLFKRVGNRRALGYRRMAVVISIVRWNLHPVIQ